MRYHCDVVGIHAKNADGSERKIYVRKYISNAEITLEKEPENRYDKNAIAVYMLVKSFFGVKKLQIGYLDRDIAEGVASFLGSGGGISNVKCKYFWIPDYEHVTPKVEISFDASWTEEDVALWRREQDRIEREKRAERLARRKIQKEARKEEEKKDDANVKPSFAIKNQIKTELKHLLYLVLFVAVLIFLRWLA